MLAFVAAIRSRMKSWTERAQSTLPVRALVAYGESKAGSYALALAFAGFISMFPTILGALAILGLAFRDASVESRFQALLIDVFPVSAQPELQQAVQGVKQAAGWLGLVSIAGLLWSAGSIFATMEFAFAEIFGTRQRDVVRQRAMSLVMMVVLVAAIVAVVAINAAADLVAVAGPVFSFALGSTVMVSLLVALYRFVPNRTFRARELIPGALLAGVLIEVVSLAFPIFAHLAGGFNTYGAQFALFFLLATWFYLLSQLILIGAVFNRFRLGPPRKMGIFASPARESREKRSPVDAIEEQKSDQGGR